MPTLALLAFTLALAPGEPLLRDPDAKAAFDAAQAAFEAEDFAEASKQLERAYMFEPEPELLYPWAQAQRNLGNCESAVDLYQRFIDTGPSERMAGLARQNIARCEETTAQRPGAAPEPEPEVAAATDDEPPPPRVAPDIDAAPGSTKPVGHDIAAGVLVGVGGAAAIVGAALLGTAARQAKKTYDVDDNATYLDMRAQTVTLQRAGIGMLVTGGVLVVAGVIRYGVVAKRRKNAAVATWWDGRGGGLAMSGRF